MNPVGQKVEFWVFFTESLEFLGQCNPYQYMAAQHHHQNHRNIHSKHAQTSCDSQNNVYGAVFMSAVSVYYDRTLVV